MNRAHRRTFDHPPSVAISADARELPFARMRAQDAAIFRVSPVAGR